MSRDSEFIEIDGIFHTPVVEKYKTNSSFRMKRVIANKPKLVCSGNFLRYPQQVSPLLLQAVHVPSRKVDFSLTVQIAKYRVFRVKQHATSNLYVKLFYLLRKMEATFNLK